MLDSERGKLRFPRTLGISIAVWLVSGIQLALLDINMPGKDGLRLLTEAKDAGREASFIMMTAESTMKNTLEAMRLGAFDYITKPFDLGELEVTIDKALENIKLKGRVTALSERLKEHLAGETVFIGKSKAVEEVFKRPARSRPGT